LIIGNNPIAHQDIFSMVIYGIITSYQEKNKAYRRLKMAKILILNLTIEQRKSYINAILAQLKLMAHTEKKPFDYGDTFLSLAFKNDTELLEIAKLCGIK
jgi:hypothetical protein